MGCGSSRSVVVPSDHNIRGSTANLKGSDKKNTSNSRVSIQSEKNNNVDSTSPDGSATDLEDNSGKRREISASSTRTADSGISELPDDDILTENSNPNRLIQAGVSKRPQTPELALEGVACPRKQSGKERRRLELQKKNSESSIPTLPPLPNNGLLERPKTRGGVAFDITFCPETGNIKKAPPNLPKLERRKKKKKLTKEELEEKMRKATERRMKHNKKIIEKSHATLRQYEKFVEQRRNNLGLETSTKNEENLDNTGDNATMSVDEPTEMESQ